MRLEGIHHITCVTADAPSNADFDAGLRAHNPEWGVRDLGDVSALAHARGLELVERISMPANNLSLVFRSRTS